MHFVLKNGDIFMGVFANLIGVILMLPGAHIGAQIIAWKKGTVVRPWH